MTISLPRLTIHDGTLEALKWLALVLMVIDHVNKYLLNDSQAWMYEAGRLAMPLFGFVLAFNLARPGLLESPAFFRTVKRLALFAVIATPPYVALGAAVGGVLGHWWPLNIMATLLMAALTIKLLHDGSTPQRLAAGALFIVAGAVVEFWWPALFLIVGFWSYCRKPSLSALLAIAAGFFLLGIINQVQWAFLSLPVIVAASFVKLRVPRLRFVFYAFYPAHLALFWLMRLT